MLDLILGTIIAISWWLAITITVLIGTRGE